MPALPARNSRRSSPAGVYLEFNNRGDGGVDSDDNSGSITVSFRGRGVSCSGCPFLVVRMMAALAVFELRRRLQ